MDWDAIKHIYYCVLIYNDKIEYLGGNKYIITSLYPSGKKHHQMEYTNGQAHGRSIGWYENGSKYWKMEYKYSELHGIYKVWSKNGSITNSMKYENGYQVNPEYLNGQKI